MISRNIRPKTTANLLISLFVVSVCLVFVIVGATDSHAQEAAPKPAVTISKVKMEIIADTASYTGRVKALSKVEIRARVTGFIESRAFTEGGAVKQGDPLFGIEPDAYDAAVTEIKGQIESADAEKRLADIEVTRQQTLYEKGTVAQSVVQKATAEQGKTEGKLLQLKGSLQRAELDQSYTKIKAPFDGRIGLANVDVGAFVSPESDPLAVITSVDPIQVHFPVTEADLIDFRTKRAEVAQSAPIEVTITMANGETYGKAGKIDFVDIEVQEGTDTVIVRAEFENSGGVLLDGQLVDVTLTEKANEQSLVIPTQSLQRDQAGYFVLLIGKDNKAEKRSIKIEKIDGALAVVSDGLKVGENVVTNGISKIRPGMEVDAAEEGSGANAKPAGK